MSYEIGGALHTSQVTVTTTATLLLAANPIRASFFLQNIGAVDCWIGPAGVTTTTGFLLKGGQTVPASYLDTTCNGAVYAVTASSTTTVAANETYSY